MAHKIIVNKEKCIGCGACASTCPGSFEMKDGKAHTVESNSEGINCEKDAESVCPVDAISVD